jgi:CelD/BcsL family acetyltransferase involved in cellulose biosynthesis
VLRRIEGFRELTILGAKNRDYEDLIILPEFQQEIFTEFFSSIREQNDWDVLQINRLREDSPNFAFLRDHCSNHNGFHSKISGITAVIPIDCEWSLYVKKLPKAMRSDPGRQMRRLKETLKEVEYKNIEDIQQIQLLFGKLVDFHRARHEEEGNRSIFTDSRKLAFHQSITKRLWEKSWLHFSALASGESILAMHYGFLYHGVYYYFIPVFNRDYSNYSVGKILMTNLLEQSFDRKDTEFDLLFGDENYKRMLNPVIRNLYTFSYFRPGISGRLASWWWTGFRPRIKSVVTHIKPALEQFTTLK